MTVARKRKLAIFDLDGTLVDSREIMCEAFDAAYSQVGLTGTAPVDRFLQLLGAPFPEILRQLHLPAEMYEIFRQESLQRIDRIESHPEAIICVLKAKLRGWRTAVLTGKDRERTEKILGDKGLHDIFDQIVAGDDALPGKPASAGIDLIRRTQGAERMNTVMVGDSAIDIHAASRAGVISIGCSWGIGSTDELRGANPTHMVSTGPELERLLDVVA